jgi:hypothetical protein
MIEVSSEQLLTLADAASLRPPGRNGRPTHVSTVYRWISSGIGGVKLEAVRLGGSLYTSREALNRFAERLTAAGDRRALSPVPAGTAARRRAAERAASVLDRIGI